MITIKMEKVSIFDSKFSPINSMERKERKERKKESFVRKHDKENLLL